MTTATRPEAPRVGTERDQLDGMLDYFRATVAMKAAGLTDEQARRAVVPSELTTVAGLLAHLTYVEQYWFCVVCDGQEDPWREAFTEDPDAEFRAGLRTPIAQLIADYEAQCQISRNIAAKLDVTAERGQTRKVNLRYVLIHMIEETARHAGHLDLLRELLDGSTGE